MVKHFLVGIALAVATTLGVPAPIPTLSLEDQRQIQCLATNVFFEAANQPTQGKIAVAIVTLNRVDHPLYPKTVCQVVYQKSSKGCQFSWVCDRPLLIKARTLQFSDVERARYQQIYSLATRLYVDGWSVDPTYGSTHYHATYITVNWRRLRKTTQIGDHIFYKFSG